MDVIKRNGILEPIQFDKIQNRLEYLTNYPTPLKHINIPRLSQEIIDGLYDKIPTSEIDTLSAKKASSKGFEHSDYLHLAARICINNHHKNTLTSFKDKMDILYRRKDANGKFCPILEEKFYKFISQPKHQKAIEAHIDYERDYLLNYTGFQKMESMYLMRIIEDNKEIIVERPQDAFMRKAIFMHYKSKPSKESRGVLDLIFETYDMFSLGYYIHGSPTIFNAGLPKAGCISCFLLDMDDDLGNIFDTIKSMALMSGLSGGIGFSCSKLRSNGSLISSTNSRSVGPIKFLTIVEQAIKVVSQGRRKGSLAVYMEPHHPDILDFLELRMPDGDPEMRCPDLHMGLWVSDLFMERVLNNEVWSLFDPHKCPELYETYGEEFEKIYLQLEEEKAYKKQVQARQVWTKIYLSACATGEPYMLFKDQVNRTSNQKNIGLIRSSNLCAEIVEVASQENKEFACCNLASLSLPKFVRDKPPQGIEADDRFPSHPTFDYLELEKVVKVAIRNLNNIIDLTQYPNAFTSRSNLNHRPVALGVQGLADVFFKFGIPYDSSEARELNQRIFETIYYSALSASTKIAKEVYQQKRAQLKKTNPEVAEALPTTYGAYSSFKGSPLSEGVFNFEMHNPVPKLLMNFDWETLREHIKVYGVANSQLIACMPTASTSTILGNTEGFEPMTSNVFLKRISEGEFYSVNEYLLRELDTLGLWTPEVREMIKNHRGSIQNIPNIPYKLKSIFRTTWELPQKAIIDLAADRGPFVCQSQSMNLHKAQLTIDDYSSMLMYGWKRGLKTGVYYLRTRPAVDADNFSSLPSSSQGVLNEAKKDYQDKVFRIAPESEEQRCSMCEG